MLHRTFRVRGAALLLALATPLAHADGLADEAELHFQIAAERYRAGDFRGALEHFMASNRLVPNRNVVFNIARAFEQLGRFADAHRYYLEALDGETHEATRRGIEAALARIAPHVAIIRVESDPPGATIYIDRRDLGSRGTAPRALAFPEGRYRVILEREGYEPVESQVVDARLGTETVVRLALRRIVGGLQVEGDAGVAVRVDDERAAPACTTPCTTELAPGTYTLFLTREGFQTQTRVVTVTARQTARVQAQLRPETGTVVVSADERDALVEIDGRSMGFTPAVIPNVPAGRRRVRVSLRGYRPVEAEVEVRSNQQAELLDLQLVPVREVTAASRTAESIEDAPSSVTVIDPRELRAFAYPTIAEALRGVRGVTLSNDGTYVSLGIRGLGQPGDFGKRLLVLADGQPLNDNLLASSYIGSDGRTDLDDLERIEVVRGPGSVLYGTGALSGVVNLVQRGADAQPGVQVGVSSYDNAVTRARARGHVAFTPNAGAWLSLAGARSDGRDATLLLADPAASPREVRVQRLESFYSGTVSGRAWWGALSAQWFHHTRDQALPQGPYGYALNDLRSHWADRRSMLEVRFEPRLSNSVQLMTRTFANVYDFDAHQSYAPDPMVRPSREQYLGIWFGGEARVVATPWRDMRISAGLEVQHHPVAQLHGEAYDDRGAAQPYLDTGNQAYSTAAAYALAEATVTRWFRFSAAARLDYFSFLARPAFNPRLALIFRPWAHGVLKVLGGSAFRAPSLYERLYNDGGNLQPIAGPLVPETVYSGEVEYSHRVADNWVALGSVYANYIERIVDLVDISIPDPMTGMPRDGIQYQNRAGGVVTAGGDVEVRREWRYGWMLSAMYGYLYARYVGANAPMDTRVINAPEHFASFRGVVPLIPGTLNGALRMTVEAPRRISLADETAMLPESERYTTPAVIADLVLSGGVPRYGVRYAAGLYNLFDWRYDNPVATGFSSRVMPQNGRSLMVQLSAEF